MRVTARVAIIALRLLRAMRVIALRASLVAVGVEDAKHPVQKLCVCVCVCARARVQETETVRKREGESERGKGKGRGRGRER